jgi:hypothetical protein
MEYPKNSVENISELINNNQFEDALNILSQNPNRSLLLQNVQAICWMRSGQAPKAVEVLTPLVYQGSSVTINPNVSESVILNLVTARLLTGNLSGAVSLLAEVTEESSMCQKLKSAIAAWKRKQSFFSRIAFALGLLPMDMPIPLDFPPGQL